MSANPNEPEPEKQKDAILEITTHAHKEIAAVRYHYYFLLSALGLVVVVGFSFTYHSAKEWKEDIRSDGQRAEKRMLEDLETIQKKENKDLEAEAERVRTEVVRRVDNEFASSNIFNLVHEQSKERIDLIADTLIQTNISNKIEPMRTELFETLKTTKQAQESQFEELRCSLTNLDAVLVVAKDTLKQLDEQSEFITAVVLADHDDRSAYDKLVNWAFNKDYRLQAPALKIVQSIITSYFNAERAFTLVNWDSLPRTSREAWGMSEIRSVWEQVIPSASARDYLNFVWGHTNITKEQRLWFLRKVYQTDSKNSLQAANKAAWLISDEFGLTYNPAFYYDRIEKRWPEFIKTNHLFSVSANSSTNRFNDIILGSDTNHVWIIRDWGDVKLVLFKLQHSVVSNSIEGMFLGDTFELNKMNPIGNNYKNVTWEAFKGINITNSKFEFQYERDVSSTNVYDIVITTNSILFDHSTPYFIEP